MSLLFRYYFKLAFLSYSVTQTAILTVLHKLIYLVFIINIKIIFCFQLNYNINFVLAELHPVVELPRSHARSLRRAPL